MAAQIVLLVLATIFMPADHPRAGAGLRRRSEQFALTVSLARITFPYLILTLVAVQLSAMLNAIDKFWAAAAWSNFQNLAMIATLLAWHWFPNAAYAAAWGVLLGGVAQLIFILWAGAREGLWLRSTWPRWSPQMAEFFVAFGAVTIGAASVVIAPFIDTILASYLPTGSRTALYYADRINQLPLGVLGIALGTVLLPEMSARLAKGDTAGIARGAEPRRGDEPAADLAVRGGLPGHSRHHHARRSSPMAPSTAMPPTWRRWRWRPMASGLPAMALVRIVAVHLLCPPRHRHAGARHRDRHGLQHRAEGRSSSGACGWAWRASRWARRWAPGSMSRC